MAEDRDDSQEKTQDPTQRRLEKAREEGKVLSSKEIFVFTSLFAGILLFYMTKYFNEDFLEILQNEENLNSKVQQKVLVITTASWLAQLGSRRNN